MSKIIVIVKEEDFNMAIEALELLTEDEREPERYREEFKLALDRLRNVNILIKY